jgi:uncharacterized repeat protein (TIGR02543 family)
MTTVGEKIQVNNNLTNMLSNLTKFLKSSKKKLIVASLFLCLIAATAGTIHLGQAQTDQISPDWTNITHNFYNLSPATTEPVLTASMVTDRTSVTFVADPCLFYEGNTWYMFFEVNQNNNVADSDIGLATSTNGLQWTYQHIVLDETFHLAHPYVFKWNGDYYMIPDTYDQNTVKLYKATSFPNNWVFVANLVSGSGYTDTCIFRYNNMWWLFTSGYSNNMDLYYSTNLTDPSSWHAHPMNPIISSDTSKARSVDSVVFNGNTIIRLAQKDDVVYGQSVRAFQVDTLTTTSYHETEISQSPLIQASGSGWNKDGMHTLDPWYTGNRWIVAVDGVNYEPTEVWSIGIYESPIFEYPLTISTNYGTVNLDNGTYGADSTQTISAIPPSTVPGERYIWLGWTGTGTGSYTGMDNPASITMSDNITETATWQHQYKLTVNSAHGTAGPLGGEDGWFDAGSSTNAIVTPSTVNGTTGTRYVFTGWSGDASGTGLTSNTIVMNVPKTATADWATQYYLNVTSTHGTTGGTGWYDTGTSANATLSSLTIAGTTGTQYAFTGWSGDASGTDSPSNDIVMTGPMTAIANWQTQYNITFAQSGVGSDFSGTLVTVNGTAYGFNGYSTWANASDVYIFNYSPLLTVSANAKQCLLTVVTGNSSSSSITALDAATINGTYKTQYYLTTTSAYGSPLPANGWYDNGTSINAFVASPISGDSGTQYVCTGWSGTGSALVSGSASATTFMITAPSTVTWNWKTQYLISFVVNPSGDGTTSPSGTNTWQDAGPISISGTPSYNHKFSSWSADTGSIAFGNSLAGSTTANINGPGNITANFAVIPAATPTPTPVRTPAPTATPSPTPAASPTPQPSNSTPTPTSSTSNNNLATNPYFYGLIIAVILAGVIVAILVIRKMKKP